MPSVDLLRRAVEHNAALVQQMFDAHSRNDHDAIRDLIVELDANNADLCVALEEITLCPPSPDPGPAAGGAGRTGSMR